MAKPIAPHPVLKGQAAIDFIEELSKNRKVSQEEILRIKRCRPNTGNAYIYYLNRSMNEGMCLIRLTEEHVFKPFDCGEQDLNNRRFPLNMGKTSKLDAYI